MADLTTMSHEALLAEHEQLGEQKRAIELRQIALGEELNRRHLAVATAGVLSGLSPAQKELLGITDGLAQIDTIRLGMEQKPVKAPKQ